MIAPLDSPPMQINVPHKPPSFPIFDFTDRQKFLTIQPMEFKTFKARLKEDAITVRMVKDGKIQFLRNHLQVRSEDMIRKAVQQFTD